MFTAWTAYGLLCAGHVTVMCTGLLGQAYHGGTLSHSGAWHKCRWPGTQPSLLPLTTAEHCMVGLCVA